jgi:hypothetical protein
MPEAFKEMPNPVIQIVRIAFGMWIKFPGEAEVGDSRNARFGVFQRTTGRYHSVQDGHCATVPEASDTSVPTR